MANFSALKTAIQNAIKQNGNEEITGDVLQQILLSIVSTMGDVAINTIEQNLSNETTTRQGADTQLQNAINAIKANIDNGYVYAGIATPSTTPVSGKVFYAALQAGTYTNFGGTAVTEGITFLKYNGTSWTKEQVLFTDGGVFDISAYHATGGTLATYADLSAALGTNGANVPANVRKGGMSVKYVHTYDNNYVQWRYMGTSIANADFANVTNWQGVDDVPTAGSNNLVKSGGIANKYGDYEYIAQDLIYAFIDSLNRVVWCIKKNGSLYFPLGIPEQVQEQLDIINAYLAEVKPVLDDINDAIDATNAYLEEVKPVLDELEITNCGYWIEAKATFDGRVLTGIRRSNGAFYALSIESPTIDAINSLISDNFSAVSDIQAYIDSVKPIADEFDMVDVGYWIEAKVTSDNKILTGIRRSDGAFYAMKIESPTIDAINNIISGSFSVTKSAYIDEEQDTADLTLEVPVLSADATLVEVETEEQLNAAITRYNSGEDLLISLKGNIGITTAKSISGSNAELTINGNGYAIYQKATEYTPSGYKGGVAYTNAAFSGINSVFVTEDAKIIPYTRSRFYNAAGRITDSEGNTFPDVNDGTSAGVRKFLLPEELRSLSIVEADNLYINFSCWFVAYNSKVIKIEDGYLYFQYQGGHNVDGDYYFAKKYTSFCFINLDINSNGITFKNNKAYFGSSISKLYNCGNFAGFIISNNTGKVKIMNVNFKGASSSNPFINNLRSTLLLENCSFEGFQHICVQNRTFDTSDPTGVPQANIGKIYVDSCLFENVYHSGVISAIDTICVVTNSIFKNIGIRRTNSSSISVLGQYYVAHNTIEDFHYNGINVGIVSMKEQHDCLGIIEKNILKQSTEYNVSANYKTVMDSGAIYVSTNNTNTVIRKNKIINYSGRANNNGIFCDDAAYNIKIYSNLIENTPNAYSISARYVDISQNPNRKTAGNTPNVNKIIAQNIVTNSILLQSDPNIATNGCVLGVNIVTNASKAVVTNNIEVVEQQIYIIGVKLVNCICQSPVSLENWNIN